MVRRSVRNGCAIPLLVLAVLVIAAVAFLMFEGRRTPAGTADYVALGSSFAAGPALGPLQKQAPLLCARTVNNYPQQLARTLRIPIVDMTCGGATVRHVLRGGQFFQGPQIHMIGARTRLVTITAGGNDIGYVGDMSMLALRRSDHVAAPLARWLWDGPRAAARRDYAGLRRDLLELIAVVRERAPSARIVMTTYPAILPARGTCARLGLSLAEADRMRGVEHAFSATVRSAAGGVILVDMARIGAQHHACSADPWTRGWTDLSDAPFHPTPSGVRATAAAIVAALIHHRPPSLRGAQRRGNPE